MFDELDVSPHRPRQMILACEAPAKKADGLWTKALRNEKP